MMSDDRIGIRNVDWKSVMRASSDQVRRLSHVWRFSSIPVSVMENTAEHSYWVALYASMIHASVMPEENALLGPVLASALVHDVAECVTGDVLRLFKYATPELKREVDRAEAIMMKDVPGPIHDLARVPAGFLEPAKEYVKAVVKAADFMSLLQFMRREAMRGNLEIEPYYMRMMEDLKSSAYSHLGKNLMAFRPHEAYEAMLIEAEEVRARCFRAS